MVTMAVLAFTERLAGMRGKLQTNALQCDTSGVVTLMVFSVPAPSPIQAAEHRFVPLVRISLSEARRLGTVHAGAPEGDGGI